MDENKKNTAFHFLNAVEALFGGDSSKPKKRLVGRFGSGFGQRAGKKQNCCLTGPLSGLRPKGR